MSEKMKKNYLNSVSEYVTWTRKISKEKEKNNKRSHVENCKRRDIFSYSWRQCEAFLTRLSYHYIYMMLKTIYTKSHVVYRQFQYHYIGSSIRRKKWKRAPLWTAWSFEKCIYLKITGFSMNKNFRAKRLRMGTVKRPAPPTTNREKERETISRSTPVSWILKWLKKFHSQ